MPPAIGIIGAVASVVGTVASISASRKAAAAQQKQQQLQRRRSSRQAIREAQIRRAQTVATAQGAGALGSSAVAGGVGSLTSQVGEQLGFSSQYSALSNIVTEQKSRADMFAGLANFGSQFADFGFMRGGGQTQTDTMPTRNAPMTSIRPMPRPS